MSAGVRGPRVSPAPCEPFDALAQAYDRYRIGYSPALYEALFEYGLAAGDRVLDLACGTGLVAAELIARRCTVVGVDASEAMLAEARQRVPAAVFAHAEAEALPFAEATFDAAVCAQAFHWFDGARAFDELARTVRPGGTVAIWWKRLARGDRTRVLRDEAAASLGLRPPADLMLGDFVAFNASPLLVRREEILPWTVWTTAAEYLGYERSRARARAAYGARLEDYFDRLSERLGPPETELSLEYDQMLYLGRAPGSAR